MASKNEWLASVDWDGMVIIWNTADTLTTGEPYLRIPDTDNLQVVWSPDGHLLAGIGNTINIWDKASLESGHPKPRIVIDNLDTSIIEATWHADSSRLATIDNQGFVQIWEINVANRTATVLHTISGGHAGWIDAVAWSPDGSLLATGSADRTVRIWDGKTGEMRSIDRSFSALVVSVDWSPDGALLASATGRAVGENEMRIWNHATGETLMSLALQDNQLASLSWSPDGYTLASGSWFPAQVNLWNASTGEPIEAKAVGDYVTSVAWSPDGKRLAIGGWSGISRTFDITSENELSDGMYLWNPDFITEVDTDAIAWSPDGTRLATGDSDGVIRIWDPTTSEIVLSLIGHRYRVKSLAFHPAGSMLVSGALDGTVRIWDTITGEELGVIPINSRFSIYVDWSPTGSQIATADGNGVIRIWQITRP